MKSEKATPPLASNGNEPATLHDLELWGGQLTSHITTVEKNLTTRLDSVEERVTRVEKTTESILNVVQSIDARLKEWKDIPERLANVEDDVFKLKVKANRRD